jgi:hypothetical protein
MRSFTILAVATLATAACAPAGRTPDHATAPGHAVGSGPSQLTNQGGQQDVVHPQTGPGAGGGATTLTPSGGGTGDATMTHAPGRGRGAGSRAPSRITGGAAAGGATVQHGQETH